MIAIWFLIASQLLALGLTFWQSKIIARLRREAADDERERIELIMFVGLIARAPVPLAAPDVVNQARRLLADLDIPPDAFTVRIERGPTVH